MANPKKKKTLFMAQFAVLLAVEMLFCFTPLGSLPAIGPIVATLSAIPVVIAAILLGTAAGSAMGFFFGLFSFIVWTFMPPSPAFAFVFTPFYSFGDFSGNFGSLLICFLPRILIGTVAGLAYKLLSKCQSNLRCAIAAALGSLTNTVLVLGGIWLFFGAEYAGLAGIPILAIIGTTVLTSGIPEAIVAAIIAAAVCRPLLNINQIR